MVKNDVHRRLRSLVGDGLKEAQLSIGMGVLPRLHVIVITGFPGESRHVKLEMESARIAAPAISHILLVWRLRPSRQSAEKGVDAVRTSLSFQAP